MMNANMVLDATAVSARVDDRLFGGFLEHLGRAVYSGIYEPGHPRAGADGFRADVLDLVRELRVPIVRYPGGNFVSSYRWEDGVGPLEKRPRRLDLAWRSVEPNLVGTDEFARWARKAGAQVMMALNLGTRGVQAAVDFVEYCNHPSGSAFSDLRRSHGAAEPFGIKTWCLGNEMDGPWQVGQKTAEEYAKLARETAKALKLFDPGLELVACGSSGPGIPTFPAWEEAVLDQCHPYIDYLSLHMYARKPQTEEAGTGPGGTAGAVLLAESVKFERFIRTVEGLTEAASARNGGRKRIMLSVDEWNVWYHSLDADKKVPPWTVGPGLLEDVYTMEDALAVGCFLIVLLRHAANVRIACLAQLVNVIAPIMTQPGGPAWRQTIFHPFLHASLYGRGEVLETELSTPGYELDGVGAVGWLEAAAVFRPADDEIALFAVNRHPREPVALAARLSGFPGARIIEHLALAHPDPQAVNDREHPDRVSPHPLAGAKIEQEMLSAALPPYSWNVIRIGVGK